MKSVARLPLLMALSALLGSGCTRSLLEPRDLAEELCGNTTLDAGEECEDGNLSINDGCPSGPGGTCAEAFCGDGFAWVEGYGANEECDDANEIAGDGCHHCQLEPNWVCAIEERYGSCWCAPGFQNNDGDQSCLPSCENIGLRAPEEHEVCDDSSGEVVFHCADDAELEPEDELCELSACDPSCGAHQKCSIDAASSTCTCRAYWVGDDCESCRVLVAPGAGCSECDGLTWSTALLSIRSGIELAASLAAGYEEHCEVWVERGHYYVYEESPADTVQLEPWVALLGGFAGDETRRDQRDPKANTTILDGHAEPDATEQVWHVVTGADHAVVDGFVITGGNAAGRHDPALTELDDDGGGMLLDGVEDMRVRNCLIVGNRARTLGGGARIVQSSVVFEDCAFVANWTWDDIHYNHGGALHSDWSETELHRCSVSGNYTTREGKGGPVVTLANSSGNRIESSLFVGNAGMGQALSNHYSPTLIYNTTFAGNFGAEYGSIIHSRETSPTLINCLFAAHDGIDIYNNVGTTTIRHSVFEGRDCGYCDMDETVIDAAPGFRAVPGTQSGTWDAVAFDPHALVTTLTDNGADWQPGALAGLFLQPNGASKHQIPIHGNTSNTIQSFGDLRDLAPIGASYAIYDYRLDATSAAIDAGTDLSAEGVLDDLSGAARGVCRINSAPNCYDAGAYEHP